MWPRPPPLINFTDFISKFDTKWFVWDFYIVAFSVLCCQSNRRGFVTVMIYSEHSPVSWGKDEATLIRLYETFSCDRRSYRPAWSCKHSKGTPLKSRGKKTNICRSSKSALRGGDVTPGRSEPPFRFSRKRGDAERRLWLNKPPLWSRWKTFKQPEHQSGEEMPPLLAAVRAFQEIKESL